jgi:signal transduction histidine kinase/integral membrane sensor domain MASE1/CheY-like chemotaxis protein
MVAALAALYLVAGRVGLSFASLHPSASVIWPATGIALAALILLGTQFWPGIFVGAFLVNISIAGHIPSSVAIAAGNTLEALAGAWLVQRYAYGRRAFETPDGVFRFAVLAGVLATMVSATFGTVALSFSGLLPDATFWRVWWTWWMGDVAGALVLAPVLIMLDRALPRFTLRRMAEGSLMASVLFVATQVSFGGWSFARLGFLCAPPLVWAAFRFGRRGAALAVLVVAAIATASTVRGTGPFAGVDPDESLLMLQAFLAVLAVTTLAIAATVAERRRMDARMRQLNDELEARIAERTAQLEAAIQELRGEVAERVRADDERRAVEARLLEAQRIAHIGSWEWTIATDTIWWSEEMYRIYELDPGTPLTYARFLEAVHPDDRAHVDGTIRGAFIDGEPFTFEHRIVRPGGEVRTLHAQGRLVCDGRGEPVRMIGTGQDITDRARADEERAALEREQLLRQEAELANRRKDEFLAILSHELRTPISSITLWSHLLREGALDEATTRRAIDVIDRNARIQGRLISDILDIARLDTGKLRLITAPVRLSEVIEAAVDALRPLAEERGVQIGMRLEALVPPVAGDADRLQQVVWNLAANAVKFSPAGASVLVLLRGVADHVEIEVRDEGPGIDPSFLPHIFDPFRQNDSSSTRRHGGLGLGLAIVHRLVELHSGSVAADNRSDRSGCVFRVRLPALSGMAADTDGNGRPALRSVPALRTVGGMRSGPPRLSGIQVLIVDDEQDAREVLSRALTAYGAEAVTSGSAAEAMAELESHAFDVLVCDVAMPEEDGCEFIARVRAHRSPQVAAIPALALTAYAGDDYVNRTLESGFQVHVAKPVEADEIALVVSRLASGVLSPVAGSAPA